MAESDSQCEGAQRGRSLWELGGRKSLWMKARHLWVRHCTGDSPHTLLLRLPRGFKFRVLHEPLPLRARTIHGARGFQNFLTIHEVYCKDFALQIILFTLAYSENTVNRYRYFK